MNPRVETLTRISTAVIAGATTPALVGLAWVRWKNGVRRELPPWRNGMGLASIVIIPAFWLFQMTRWLMLSMNRDLTATYRDLREFELFLPSILRVSSSVSGMRSKGDSPAADDCGMGCGFVLRAIHVQMKIRQVPDSC